jgi:predicted transcriptional regulator
MSVKLPKITKREKSIVLNLSAREMEALDSLADRKGQTKSAVLRQALRLYEALDSRVSSCERLVLEAPDKSEKSEVFWL